jgi:hypothetical protein
MRNFYDDDDDELETLAPSSRPSRELTAEVLKLLTASLAFVASIVGLATKYQWLIKPWVVNVVIALGVLTLGWFAKPRVVHWLHRIKRRKREQQFVATNDARLREFVEQFAEFLSDNNTKSLRYIVRSACSQNMTEVEKILSGDYLGNWLFSFREQLMFPERSLGQFLARCREFTNIVQQFNSNYAHRAQKLFTTTPTPPLEHVLDELEGFREDYNAFVRNLEPWGKGIAAYLQSVGITDTPTQWRLAPVTYFDKPKSFKKSQVVMK